MDDVFSRRVAGDEAFGGNRGMNAAGIGEDFRILRVSRVSLERENAYGGQNGQNRNDDNEFRQGESLNGLTKARLAANGTKEFHGRKRMGIQRTHPIL